MLSLAKNYTTNLRKRKEDFLRRWVFAQKGVDLRAVWHPHGGHHEGKKGDKRGNESCCAFAQAEISSGISTPCKKDVYKRQLAAEHNIRTLDFSSISTGIYGYPLPLAATVALRTIMAFLADHPIPERVRMVCHSEAAAAVYRQTWNLWYAEEKDQRL